MKKLTFVCASIVLVPVLHAQKAPPQQQTPNVQSSLQYEQNLDRQTQHSWDALGNNEYRFRNDSLASLTKLRAKLAEAWQTMGMSPEAAQVVAAAYQPDYADNDRQRVSVQGKNDEQVAAMLRSALTAKNYILANQLLIDYQRAQLKLGTSSTAARY